MGKIKRNNKKIIQEPQQTRQYNVFDAFQNALARTGINTPSLLQMTDYPLSRLSRDYNLMNSLYRSHWIIKKIINMIPEDMVKNWIDVTAELAPQAIDRINKLTQRTLVKEKLLEGLQWGRLYGGAAVVIMIEGHEEILDESLDLDTIMPHAFKGLMPVDRWSGVFPDITLVADINDPEFGLPDTYEIRDIGTERLLTRVHHSRILRCIGRKLPFWEDLAEVHWGASEVEHVYDELVKRDNTSWNIASLVFQANILVNKIEGLEQLLALNDPMIQQQFYNAKSAANQMRNNNGMMMIGKEEEVSALQYSFSGLDSIYESFMLDIAGASDIPVTKLFGRSPAGMNSTGESDLQNYYDMIALQQETVLRPKLNKLLPIMFMSEFGYVPDDLDFKFNPVQSPTEEREADIVGKKSQSILAAYTTGVITQRMALSELHELSFTTNMFTSITDEDIEAADNNLQQVDEMGGMPGAGGMPGEHLPTFRQQMKPQQDQYQEQHENFSISGQKQDQYPGNIGFMKKRGNIAREGEKPPIDQSLNEPTEFSLPTRTSEGNSLTKRLAMYDDRLNKIADGLWNRQFPAAGGGMAPRIETGLLKMRQAK